MKAGSLLLVEFLVSGKHEPNRKSNKEVMPSCKPTFSLLSHPPETTRFEELRNPTDLTGLSWTPICWATLLGGVSPSRHIRTALSAPAEKTVEPSAEKHVSMTGILFSWLTWALGWAATWLGALHWTSQTRTPESQLEETRKFAVGDQFREEIPSVPACGTQQSPWAIDRGLPDVGAGDPNVDIVGWETT